MNKFWEEVHEEKRKKVCTYVPLVAEDDYQYEVKMCDVGYNICPAGHKIQVSEKVIG